MICDDVTLTIFDRIYEHSSDRYFYSVAENHMVYSGSQFKLVKAFDIRTLDGTKFYYWRKYKKLVGLILKHLPKTVDKYKTMWYNVFEN